MASISLPTAIIGSAVISAGTSLLGSSQSSNATSDAAGLQAQVARENAVRSQPFVDAGRADLPQLNALALSNPSDNGPNYLAQADGQQPGQMTQAELEATPGYQFVRSQGLQATQNAAAAKGLGISGAALKGAATYATGLADSTYQNQFNNAQTRFQNLLNLNTTQQGNWQNQFQRALSASTLGANAASQVATNQTASAATQGNLLAQAGQQSAAGLIGAGNAASGAANNFLTFNALNKLTGSGGGGGSSSFIDSGTF